VRAAIDVRTPRLGSDGPGYRSACGTTTDRSSRPEGMCGGRHTRNHTWTGAGSRGARDEHEVRSSVAPSVLAAVSEPRSQPVGGWRCVRFSAFYSSARSPLPCERLPSRAGGVKGRHPVLSAPSPRVEPPSLSASAGMLWACEADEGRGHAALTIRPGACGSRPSDGEIFADQVHRLPKPGCATPGRGAGVRC